MLRDGIGDRGRRARLYGLMRYCSGAGLMPTSVDDAVLWDYLRYRAETTSLAANTMAHRSIARAWNACADESRGLAGAAADGAGGQGQGRTGLGRVSRGSAPRHR